MLMNKHFLLIVSPKLCVWFSVMNLKTLHIMNLVFIKNTTEFRQAEATEDVWPTV